MSSIAEFFKELQRRSVIRAAIVHVLFFWLLVQVADVVLPYIGIVDDPVRWAILAGVGLFPATLIIAWFFEHPWTHVTRGRVATDIILIILIGFGATTWVMRNLPQVVHTRTSIVVLPFEHSGLPGEEGLSRALAYEVNSLLMKSKSIDVIGFESATSDILSGLDALSVAHRLGVQHVLSGTIATQGDAMRIDLQLLDRAGNALWDSIIEDSLDNLFSIQEDIAISIESRLGTAEGAVPVADVAANRCWMPTDPAAVEKFYTARYLIELRTDTDSARQGIAEAIRLYENLIGEYPKFAEAHSGLAWARLHQSNYDRANAADNLDQVVDQLASTALEHCPTLSEALHLVPNEFDHENPWIGSHRQLIAFVDMEPHRTENYQRLARLYQDTGLLDQAIDTAERNYAMNPLSVRSIKELASNYKQVRRVDEAIELFDLAIELGSTSPNFARTDARLWECEGDIECFLNGLPPDFAELKEPFRNIYTPPASEEEAGAKRAAAMQLLQQVPFLNNWFAGTSCAFPHLSDELFFDVLTFSTENNVYWYWPNVWNPNCGAIWASPQFPDFVEEAGLVEFWREVSWPRVCRPEGDSFACGLD